MILDMTFTLNRGSAHKLLSRFESLKPVEDLINTTKEVHLEIACNGRAIQIIFEFYGISEKYTVNSTKPLTLGLFCNFLRVYKKINSAKSFTFWSLVLGKDMPEQTDVYYSLDLINTASGHKTSSLKNELTGAEHSLDVKTCAEILHRIIP